MKEKPVRLRIFFPGQYPDYVQAYFMGPFFFFFFALLLKYPPPGKAHLSNPGQSVSLLGEILLIYITNDQLCQRLTALSVSSSSFKTAVFESFGHKCF